MLAKSKLRLFLRTWLQQRSHDAEWLDVDGLHAVFIDSSGELINMLDGALEDCHVVSRIITMVDCPGMQDSDTLGLGGTALSMAALAQPHGGRHVEE